MIQHLNLVATILFTIFCVSVLHAGIIFKAKILTRALIHFVQALLKIKLGHSADTSRKDVMLWYNICEAVVYT